MAAANITMTAPLSSAVRRPRRERSDPTDHLISIDRLTPEVEVLAAEADVEDPVALEHDLHPLSVVSLPVVEAGIGMRRHDTGFVGSTAHGLVGGSTGGIDVGDAERPAGAAGRPGALGRPHGPTGAVVPPRPPAGGA